MRRASASSDWAFPASGKECRWELGCFFRVFFALTSRMAAVFLHLIKHGGATPKASLKTARLIESSRASCVFLHGSIFQNLFASRLWDGKCRAIWTWNWSFPQSYRALEAGPKCKTGKQQHGPEAWVFRMTAPEPCDNFPVFGKSLVFEGTCEEHLIKSNVLEKKPEEFFSIFQGKIWHFKRLVEILKFLNSI